MYGSNLTIQQFAYLHICLFLHLCKMCSILKISLTLRKIVATLDTNEK